MKKLTVLVVFGGRSAEHEVSIRSARSIVNALSERKYKVIPVAISKSGKWLPSGHSAKILGPVRRKLLTPRCEVVSSGGKRALLCLAGRGSRRVDVVFPVLHGPYGEDGTVQGLFELADVPYVGSGVTGSGVGMDKDILKRIFREAGLPVVDFLMVRRSTWRKSRRAVTREVRAKFDLPVFVKPACLGSSVGICKVKTWRGLAPAIDCASRFDTKILVEQGVKNARELECSVLGNDEPLAACVGEIIPGSEFYDYDEKYFRDTAKLVVPAKLPKRVSERIRRISVEAFKVAQSAGMARVDFLMDRRTGKLYLSELNTIPGFTSISMYPRMWECCGISYPKLVDRLIELALERHADRSDIRVER